MFTVPPTISEHTYKEKIILKAGQSTAIEIPFVGSPQPSVEWKYKNGKLPDSKRFKVDTVSGLTSMTMAKVIRSDTGKYSVQLANEHGNATFEIDVTVLGEPHSRITGLTYRYKLQLQ